MTIVKFNDLKAQWDLIKNTAVPRLDNIFETCSYILGPDVRTFEKNFATHREIPVSASIWCLKERRKTIFAA